jgi:hypothetical protein
MSKHYYPEHVLDSLENGYDYDWTISNELDQTDIDLFDRLCDRIREDSHDGSCWDLLKVFDQFAHEYCRKVPDGKIRDIE